MSPVSLAQFLAIPWVASEMIVFLRDRQPGGGERRDRASRLAIFAGIGLGVVLAIRFAHLGVWPLPGPAFGWLAAGGAIMIFAIAFRHRAVRWLGVYFRTKVTSLDDHKLVTDGPYARLRHPSYTGVLLCCSGYGIAFASLASALVLTILPGLALAYRIRVEERALAERFGPEWDAYRGRTSALIPGIW